MPDVCLFVYLFVYFEKLITLIHSTKYIDVSYQNKPAMYNCTTTAIKPAYSTTAQLVIFHNPTGENFIKAMVMFTVHTGGRNQKHLEEDL